MPLDRYMANPSVSLQRTPEGGALLNADSAERVAINPVGCIIWEALARPRTVDQIAGRVIAACPDAPPGEVSADVADFCEALQPKGFVGRVWPPERPLPIPEPSPEGENRSPDLAPDGASDHRWVYHGESMALVFSPGDILLVESVSIAEVRRGDVVVYHGFTPAGQPTDVVHRVVEVTPQGLRTRGDNNRLLDHGLLTEDALLGRVARVVRGGRARVVHGGGWGLWNARVRRGARRLWLGCKAAGRPAYRWLRQSGFVRLVWRPRVTRLLVTNGARTVLKIVHRGRTVAWIGLRSGRGECIKPYDLVLARPDGNGWAE